MATKKTVKADYPIQQDPFTLYADYPDPFLPDSTADPKDPPEQTGHPTALPPPSPPIVDNAAEIQKIIVYNGIISNSKKRNSVAIVTIFGKEYMVREQEKINGIKILKIAKNKLLVSYKGEVLTIGK